MDPIAVSFLGAGDAFCASGRHQAAYLVQASHTTFLLDCGATTLASLKRDRVDLAAIDTVFLSHLHGDHFGGLPYLFLEYVHQTPRSHPLRIAGPPGTRERVWDLFRASYRDSAAQELPYPLEFIELKPDRPAELDGMRVEPFRVPHTETDISLGLRVAVDGRTILYSGDTGWTEEIVRRSEGSDLFICECTFYETRLDFHLDYPRLEQNHHRFDTRRLILTHLGREMLARRADVALELASDGLKISL